MSERCTCVIVMVMEELIGWVVLVMMYYVVVDEIAFATGTVV